MVVAAWGTGGGCGWCWCPNGVAGPQDNGSGVLGVVAVSQMWRQCLGVLAVSKGGFGVQEWQWHRRGGVGVLGGWQRLGVVAVLCVAVGVLGMVMMSKDGGDVQGQWWCCSVVMVS